MSGKMVCILFGTFSFLCGMYGNVFPHTICRPEDPRKEDCDQSQDPDPNPPLLGYEKKKTFPKEEVKGQVAGEAVTVRARLCLPATILPKDSPWLDSSRGETDCRQPGDKK